MITAVAACARLLAAARHCGFTTFTRVGGWLDPPISIERNRVREAPAYEEDLR